MDDLRIEEVSPPTPLEEVLVLVKATAINPSNIEFGTFPAPPVETFRLDEGPRLYRDAAESKN